MRSATSVRSMAGLTAGMFKVAGDGGERKTTVRIGRRAEIVGKQGQLAIARRRQDKPVKQFGETFHGPSIQSMTIQPATSFAASGAFASRIASLSAGSFKRNEMSFAAAASHDGSRTVILPRPRSRRGAAPARRCRSARTSAPAPPRGHG
jgi:hypothetical protein